MQVTLRRWLLQGKDFTLTLTDNIILVASVIALILILYKSVSTEIPTRHGLTELLKSSEFSKSTLRRHEDGKGRISLLNLIRIKVTWLHIDREEFAQNINPFL